MRKLMLTSAVLLGAALAMPASAQTATGARPGHEPGVGDSFPASDKASNINAADARSQIAPRLPEPPSGAGASPTAFLRDAQSALNRRQTGAAQEALERAETAILNDPANPLDPTTGERINDQVQSLAEQARQALGRRDLGEAQRLVTQALAQAGSGGASASAMPSRPRAMGM